MQAPPAMIPMVLELETQAAGLVDQARAEAEARAAKAREERESARQAAAAETAAQVERHRGDARRTLENEVNKLRSSQAQSLDAIRQLPAETLARGVSLVLDRLRGARG